jgi:hypothetical protein
VRQVFADLFCSPCYKALVPTPDDFPIKFWNPPKKVYPDYHAPEKRKLELLRPGFSAQVWANHGLRVHRWAEDLGLEVTVTCEGVTEKGWGRYKVFCVSRTESRWYWTTAQFREYAKLMDAEKARPK